MHYALHRSNFTTNSRVIQGVINTSTTLRQQGRNVTISALSAFTTCVHGMPGQLVTWRWQLIYQTQTPGNDCAKPEYLVVWHVALPSL